MLAIDSKLAEAILARKLQGDSDTVLLERLSARGIPEDEAQAILTQVISERLKAYNHLYRKLRKTEGLLEILRELRQMNSSGTNIAERNSIDGRDFLDQFYSRNQPVVLRGCVKHWPAVSKWNTKFFRKFGDRQVEAMLGRESDSRFELNRDEHKRTIAFDEFLD